MYFTHLRLNGLSVIDLHISDAKPSDMYILKNADGLGPTEVEVSIVDTLNAGGYYQGRKPQAKELVILVGLNPDFGVEQTASDLRQSLYGLLTPGAVDNVKIEIMRDADSLAYVTGYVKKLEINPFAKTPEVQLTFACLQPYWKTATPIYLDPGDKVYPVLTNIGTAPAGFHMEILFNAWTSGWTLFNDVNAKMQMDYNFAFDDALIINTQPGVRGLWRRRASGTVDNIIFALSPDSIWFMLHGGENKFRTNIQTFNWGEVYYTPQYWGI